MSARFRHEDVASVPSGWKVRTVTAGSHRVRVAFPPGRRHKGSGRLVSVLHPLAGKNPCANPCALRSANPAELMVMSANNPPRRRSEEAKKQRQQEMIRRLIIKKAEQAERRGHKELAEAYREMTHRNPAELLVMSANPRRDLQRQARERAERIRAARLSGSNPRVEVVHGDNPPVEEIAEEFSGVDVKYIDVYNEPHIPRGRYAYLAKLYRLMIKPEKGGQVQRVTFNQTDPPLIVSDSTGKQIYFVGGQQDLTECLAAFTNQGGDRVVLGEGREIHYIGKKHHIGDEDTDEWRHKHGEEDGLLPTVVFDAQSKRLLYEGGNYRIEGPWMHN